MLLVLGGLREIARFLADLNDLSQDLAALFNVLFLLKIGEAVLDGRKCRRGARAGAHAAPLAHPALLSVVASGRAALDGG
eukprot:m.343921 g.343921  ORF g.343921 m.343921 type:complete len:80 (+) comp55784_c0_seq2:2335-2574(+)